MNELHARLLLIGGKKSDGLTFLVVHDEVEVVPGFECINFNEAEAVAWDGFWNHIFCEAVGRIIEKLAIENHIRAVERNGNRIDLFLHQILEEMCSERKSEDIGGSAPR